MRIRQYITENIEKLEKIKNVFSNIPKGTPDSISNYISKALIIFGIKSENGNHIYLSGPMSNLPDDNWPVFIHAEKYINGKVVNPAKPHGKILKKNKADFDWYDYMIEDVYDLLKCNKILILPGYSKSVGAITEIQIGKKLLGISPKQFREEIGNKKFDLFIKDVKKQYIDDGFEKEYHSIIEPMLLSKSENDACKFVKAFTHEEKEIINEIKIENIKNFMKYIKEGSLKSVLKLIGLILKNSNVKKMIR